MKRILILMADYGYGHRSAANAISEALQTTHGQDCVVEIVNPLNDERAPALLRDNQANYDRLVREMPDLFGAGYSAGACLEGTPAGYTFGDPGKYAGSDRRVFPGHWPQGFD